jgi:hypothetical protein
MGGGVIAHALQCEAQFPSADGRDKPGHDLRTCQARLSPSDQLAPHAAVNFSLKMRSCGTPEARAVSSVAAMSGGGPQT